MITDLYHKDILRHAAAARGHGRLDPADGSATVDNPLCGDRVHVDVKLTDGHIAEIAQDTRACVLCQASVSIIAARAVGETAQSLEALAERVRDMLDKNAPPPDGKWADFAVFDPVRETRSRHSCVLLPFEAVAKALAEATGRKPKDGG